MATTSLSTVLVATQARAQELVPIPLDPAAVEAGGRSAVCPVVALDGAPSDVVERAAPGAVVAAGEPLLEWR